MGRHIQAAQPEIAQHIRHTAIEDDRPSGRLRLAIGAQLPAQHQLGKRRPVRPWQRLPADRHLLANDGAARLRHPLQTTPAQRLDQRGFARSRAAGDDDETVLPLRPGARLHVVSRQFAHLDLYR